MSDKELGKLSVEKSPLDVSISKVSVGIVETEKIQDLVNSLLTFPQYAQYVKDHKLKLIDSRLAGIDALLDLGIVKA